jgi:hypothetical protein
MHRDKMRAGLARAIQVIRSAADALQRRFGTDAAEITIAPAK